MIKKITAVIRQTIQNFFLDDCLTIASSISFVFLLSIIPFLSLAIFLTTTIQELFFHEQFILETSRDLLSHEIVRLIPFISQAWVEQHLISSAQSSSSFTIINIMLLPITSSIIFKTLESAYRRIFRLPGRHLILSQIFYSMLTITIAIASFILTLSRPMITRYLDQVTSSVSAMLVRYGFTPITTQVTIFSQEITIASLVLILIFYLVTLRIFLTIRISLAAQFFTAFFFCTLWVFSRIAFWYYIEHISKVDVLYGSLSSVVIILTWVFYCSTALLLCVELLYAIHSSKKSNRKA